MKLAISFTQITEKVQKFSESVLEWVPPKGAVNVAGTPKEARLLQPNCARPNNP